MENKDSLVKGWRSEIPAVISTNQRIFLLFRFMNEGVVLRVVWEMICYLEKLYGIGTIKSIDINHNMTQT